MARAVIGESKSDKAYARMEKALAKSDRAKEREGIDPKAVMKTENPIIAQLKALYPKTWRSELRRLQDEYAAQAAAKDTLTMPGKDEQTGV